MTADGRIIVDSGVLNTELLSESYGRKSGRLFGDARLRDRLDAIIAHEFEEHRNNFDHRRALAAAPTTVPGISRRAREIAHAMQRSAQTGGSNLLR